MFLKRSRGGSKKSPRMYIQLVQSYRDKNNIPRHKVICTLGREDELINNGIIDNLTCKFAELSKKLIVLNKEKGEF